MMAVEYFIVSIEKTRPVEGCVTFYRAASQGYTHLLEAAGRFTEEEVNADLDTYDNGLTTMAVLCDVAEQHAHSMVPLGALTSGEMKRDNLMRIAG